MEARDNGYRLLLVLFVLFVVLLFFGLFLADANMAWGQEAAFTDDVRMNEPEPLPPPTFGPDDWSEGPDDWSEPVASEPEPEPEPSPASSKPAAVAEPESTLEPEPAPPSPPPKPAAATPTTENFFTIPVNSRVVMREFIRKFALGSTILPLGWEQVVNRVVAGCPPPQACSVECWGTADEVKIHPFGPAALAQALIQAVLARVRAEVVAWEIRKRAPHLSVSAFGRWADTREVEVIVKKLTADIPAPPPPVATGASLPQGEKKAEAKKKKQKGGGGGGGQKKQQAQTSAPPPPTGLVVDLGGLYLATKIGHTGGLMIQVGGDVKNIPDLNVRGAAWLVDSFYGERVFDGLALGFNFTLDGDLVRDRLFLGPTAGALLDVGDFRSGLRSWQGFVGATFSGAPLPKGRWLVLSLTGGWAFGSHLAEIQSTVRPLAERVRLVDTSKEWQRFFDSFIVFGSVTCRF